MAAGRLQSNHEDLDADAPAARSSMPLSNGTKEATSKHVQLLSCKLSVSSADDLLPWDLKKVHTCTAALPGGACAALHVDISSNIKALAASARPQACISRSSNTDVTDLCTRAAVYSGSKRSVCAHLSSRMSRRRRWLTAMKKIAARCACEQILWRSAARGTLFSKGSGFWATR
jgi:hypothetical protein